MNALSYLAPFLLCAGGFLILLAVIQRRITFDWLQHVAVAAGLAVAAGVIGLYPVLRKPLARSPLPMLVKTNTLLLYVAVIGIVLALLTLLFSRERRWARTLLLLSLPIAATGGSTMLRGSGTLGFYLLGAAVLTAAAGTLFLRGTDRPLQPIITWTRNRELLVISLLLAFTLFVKLYKFEGCLAGIAIDEAVKGRVALDILEGRANYQPFFFYRESPYFYMVAASMWFFGPTVTAMRLTSTAIAFVALWFMYALLRRMFGVETALAGTVFLNVSLWHNNVSRITQRLVLVPLMQSVILYLIYRIFTRGGWWRYALLGVAAAFSFYTYPPIRVLPGVLILAALYVLIQNPRWSLRQLPWVALAAVFFLGTIMVPLGKDGMNWPDYFLTSSKLGYHVDPWAKSMADVEKNVSALFYTWHTRTAAYGTVRPVNVNIPLLDPMVAMLCVVGLGIAMARVHKFPCYLLLVTFMAGLVPGVLSWPFQRRLIIATLVTYGFAGLAFVFLWEQVRHAFDRFRFGRRLLLVLIPLSLCFPIFTGWSILEDKFFSYNLFKNRTAALEYAATLKDTHEVVMFTSYFDPNTYLVACHDRMYGEDFKPLEHIRHANQAKYIPFPEELIDRNLCYILDAPKQQSAIEDAITGRYPCAVRDEHVNAQGQVICVSFQIPKEEANRVLNERRGRD
ncbi:glycosyltransferase family 39 protein [bacterium]|nr:glycosyltransferase family 39 protein [candidate division CSSED10-310 bacterium]